MRDPNSFNSISTNVDENEVFKIDNIPEYETRDWDLENPKEFEKYIRVIERNIRTSFEYRGMMKYLKENLDMNKCSFYSDTLSLSEEVPAIKIEMHHEPITLYDLCIIIYNKRSFYHENLSEELIEKEVMLLHYKLMVGLIPLSVTAHELVHNKYLFIPADKVYGNYKAFVDMYRDFMLPEQLDVLNKIEDYTKVYNSDEFKNVLAKKYIYLDLSNSQELPKYEDIIEAMRSRITTIVRKDNK